tara:strand:+ start:3943 stop:4671 length:729 start_codon:yes stop_codon:yes gene_type:complete
MAIIDALRTIQRDARSKSSENIQMAKLFEEARQFDIKEKRLKETQDIAIQSTKQKLTLDSLNAIEGMATQSQLDEANTTFLELNTLSPFQKYSSQQAGEDSYTAKDFSRDMTKLKISNVESSELLKIANAYRMSQVDPNYNRLFTKKMSELQSTILQQINNVESTGKYEENILQALATTGAVKVGEGSNFNAVKRKYSRMSSNKNVLDRIQIEKRELFAEQDYNIDIPKESYLEDTLKRINK